MKQNKKVYQLIGFDTYWVCVVYDMIMFNHGDAFCMEVFPNISTEIKAADRLVKVPFEIKKMQEIQSKHHVLFGVASGRNKYRIYNDFSPYLKDKHYDNLIANSSIVSNSCSISNGVFIDHQCVISSQSSIGFGVTIKRGSKIGHHNKIGEFTDINPGVITSGNASIGRGCEIGSGAVLNNNVTIGDNSFIGMGSIVTKDIPANSIAYGNPCKVVRQNHLWEV